VSRVGRDNYSCLESCITSSAQSAQRSRVGIGDTQNEQAGLWPEIHVFEFEMRGQAAASRIPGGGGMIRPVSHRRSSPADHGRTRRVPPRALRPETRVRPRGNTGCARRVVARQVGSPWSARAPSPCTRPRRRPRANRRACGRPARARRPPGAQRRSRTSSAATAASARMIPPSHNRSPPYAAVSDLPPRFTHARHTANVVTPPSVSSQQSPHVGRRHRAHGPAAIAPQCEQRAPGGSPADISEVTAAMFARLRPRRSDRGRVPLSAAVDQARRVTASG
jgi:hypothetical protein